MTFHLFIILRLCEQCERLSLLLEELYNILTNMAVSDLF